MQPIHDPLPLGDKSWPVLYIYLFIGEVNWILTQIKQ